VIVGHKKIAEEIGLSVEAVIGFVKKMNKGKIGYVPSGDGDGFICDQDKFIEEMYRLSDKTKKSYRKRRAAAKLMWQERKQAKRDN